jgi:16S rRNA (guanine966-N2)-methyltransferase
MTRIIGGAAGGRRIETPKGDATRPTSDRVREALFSTLEAWFGAWDGVAVLDLYAGSGAIGLEAASRGATYVHAVESDRRTAELVRRNARALGSVVEVAAQPVARFLSQPAPRPVDLVFLDPPYPLSEEELATDLRLLVELGWLAHEALVVVERSRRSPEPRWPAGLEPLSGKRGMKKYGETTLWFATTTGPLA